jgi:hypothetical protein
MSTRGCFENRTFHIYTEGAKNRNCSNESSNYTQKLKLAAIMDENCTKVNLSTSGLSTDVVARQFGYKYPNYQIRNNMFYLSCNKIK